jgi:cation diffusion facilitator family transporter
MVEHSSRTAVIAALLGNIAIAITKGIAATLSGSSAMLSEAVHSVVDSGNEVLLLYGQHRSNKPPDRLHPWGYGREIYFWSFVVALLIFALGAGVSIYEGVQHIRDPEPMTDPLMNYAVYAASAVFEGISWWFGWSAFQRVRGDKALFAAVHASKDPPSFMVLFEDSAALVGLVIAAIATALSTNLDAPWIDGLGSICIGLVLAVVAVLLARESKDLLIGEPARPELAAAVLRTAREVDGIERAQVVFSVHMAPDQVVIALSLEFRDDLTANQIESTVDLLEERIQQRHQDVIAVFVKPEHQSAPVTLPGRFRNVRLNRASMTRVDKARQPEHDLRKHDAQSDAEPLQRHEVHRGAEDRRHGDFGRRDAFQIEQRVAERRR